METDELVERLLAHATEICTRHWNPGELEQRKPLYEDIDDLYANFSGLLSQMACAHTALQERVRTLETEAQKWLGKEGFDRLVKWQEHEAEAARWKAVAEELAESGGKLLPPEMSDWWCPTCQTALAGSRVTNDERCDTCGTYLPPEQHDDPRWEPFRQALSHYKEMSDEA